MKRTVLWIIVDSVFIVVFNACFFLIAGIDHPSSVWLSYGFIHVSYLLAIASPQLVGKDAERRRIIALPVTTGAVGYFFIELIVGVICILLRAENMTATFLIQLILLGVFVLYLVANLLANMRTNESVVQHQAQVDYLKANTAMLQELLARTPDATVRKQMEAAYDDLRSSPAKTDATLYATELAIQQSILWLKDNLAVSSPEVVLARIAELRTQIAARNRALMNINR